MPFKCPLCDFKTDKFFTLKQHFIRTHNLSICPSCGKRIRKNISAHARSVVSRSKVSDKVKKEHMVIYALTGMSESSSFYRECRDYAMKVLEEGDEG